ncbi:ABC-2 type transport system permease protein [Anaerocolumna jejuensis DSM 15929]|jgi:ABC-2 type transport system permease protein|uniref:ABC-2 type transport system permease protein n=1 Tax=Anaerocolumna jejuensis DSM 15929 TaxID=1121322 RepID=A0A1M6QYL0_9FIRM|nr:ABC transporter permease [Anaerocolumna jejuensis]SHK25157.1 ABC-2 type transport system permease protein [Anaerocolumna jejuensis DSM 15929]
MLAIFKKELKSYFTSMTGYVFIAFFLVIVGIYYAVFNLINRSANFENALSGLSFIFVLLVPILTMRLMAEDKKQKTDQLLFTSPVSIGKIISGKYFAVLTVFLISMLIICFYPLILMQFGSVPLKSAYSAILGFTLLGAAYISIGLFISSLTESQMVSAVVTFVVMLITVLMDSLVNFLPTDNRSCYIVFFIVVLLICWLLYSMMHNITVALTAGVIGEAALTIIYVMKPALYDGLLTKVLGWFSVIARYDNFSSGLLDLTSIVYYISIVFIFLFLTVQAIKKHRWN